MPLLKPPGTDVLIFEPEAYLTQSSVNNFPSNDLSISLWLAWDCQGKKDDYMSNYNLDPGTATLINYDEDAEMQDSNNRLWITNVEDVTVWVGGSSTSSTPQTKIDVSDGYWHHLAITLKKVGSTYEVKIYHNGKEPAKSSVYLDDDFSFRSGMRLVFGQRYFGDSNDSFIGLAAELVVWNKVISQDEVNQAMNAEQSLGSNGVVLYWPLDKNPDNVQSNAVQYIKKVKGLCTDEEDTGGGDDDDLGLDF